MMKNIIVLEDSSKAKFGGGQKISLYVMEELSKRHTVILADTYCKEDQTIFQQKAIPFVKKSIKLSAYGRIGTKATASYNIGIKESLLFPFYLIVNLFILYKVLKGLKEDNVLYSATKKTLVYAFFLKIFLGYPYIFHMHSAESKNKIVQLLMRIMYKKAHSVICVSKFVSDQLNLRNSTVIYNPVSSSSSSVSSRSIENKDVIVVASFSTLLKYKGIEIFMKSYQYLSHFEGKIRFKVYGDGPEKDHLQRLEREEVTLCGFVEDTENTMKEIDLLVIPSIAEETFGMTAAEAMTQGIPVVVTNIGGQAEIVPDDVAGLHVEPGNPEALARAISKIIENNELYSRLSKGAYETSLHYSFVNFNRAINKVF